MLTRNRLTAQVNSDTDQDAVISVGKDYQAKLPVLQKQTPGKHYTRKRYETEMWSNEILDLSEDKLSEFINNAKLIHNYSEEMVLGLISWEKGILEEVEKDFMKFVPKDETWSTEDKIKFFMALETHNKNFNIVKELFPHKTVGQLVSTYYLFKKNVGFLNELNAGIPAIGNSIVMKAKKFESVLPKYYLSKFGNIIKHLPKGKSGIPLPRNVSWSDHPQSESLKRQVDRIEEYNNLYCTNRHLDHELLSFEHGASRTKRTKRMHQCVYKHGKWLKQFYKFYEPNSVFQHLQMTREERNDNLASIDKAIDSSKSLLTILEPEIMNKSKDMINSMKKYRSKIPDFSSEWTSQDIQLLQLAIRQCGGEAREVANVLGTKTVNMVRHFVSLYSQRIRIDDDILKRLLSSSNSTN